MKHLLRKIFFWDAPAQGACCVYVVKGEGLC